MVKVWLGVGTKTWLGLRKHPGLRYNDYGTFAVMVTMICYLTSSFAPVKIIEVVLGHLLKKTDRVMGGQSHTCAPCTSDLSHAGGQQTVNLDTKMKLHH